MADDAGVEEEIRAKIRAAVDKQDAVRRHLEETLAGLPVPPPEEAQGEEDPDFPTEARSTIECVLHDEVRPAIRKLNDLADYRPGVASGEGS